MLLRYVLNGIFATGVHYGILEFVTGFLTVESKGLANFIASIFGISCSFLGNRIFVFRAADAIWVRQATRFLLLYGAIALMNGLLMFLWADLSGFDYRVGFLLIVVIQFLLSYIGNQRFVFDTTKQ